MSPDQGPTAHARLHPHLKVLRTVEEFPNGVKVLTAPGAALQTSDSQRKIYVVVELAAKQVCVVWTNLFSDRTQFMAVKLQCERAGYHVAETMEATADLLERFYASASHQSVREPMGSVALRADIIFDELIADALSAGASSIHWQADATSCHVLFRVHGAMIPHKAFTRQEADRLARAVFTFTDERSRTGGEGFTGREFLSASITRVVEAKGASASSTVELRWDSHPTYGGGWDITQRMLRIGQDGQALDFEALGYGEAQVAAALGALQAPQGLILVVGGNGAAKPAALAALMRAWLVSHPNRKLISVEDPVEHLVPGVRQIAAVANGFDAAMRIALRAEPDAIAIGELRGEQAAKVACEAVNTGSLVMSTLPAASVIGAIERLLTLGMTPVDLADEVFLRLVIRQVELPRLCTSCRVPWASMVGSLRHEQRQAVERHFGGNIDAVYVRKHDGCPSCGNRGFEGHTVVAEMLLPDHEILQFIARFKVEGSGAQALAHAYWRSGLSTRAPGVQGRTCLDQAMDKIRAGILCPLEVETVMGSFDAQTSVEDQRAFYERNRSQIVG